MAEPAVGCRVRIIKDYATVRYIGTVAKQEGTWVGVEWDDPSRGKHDGSTGGIRYFDCESCVPTAGSFVRIERVAFGVSVLDAVTARYNNQTAEYGEDVGEDELYVHTSRKRRVQVFLVGQDKIQNQQRQIHLLEAARLVGMDVASVGDPAALAAALPALAALDLTCNLVAAWAFVEGLAAALPRLALLNLSENRIRIPPPPPGSAPSPLPGLRALVLNDCGGLTWHEALRAAARLPCLEELHLGGNGIADLEPPAEGAGEGPAAAASGPAAAAAAAEPPQPSSAQAAAGPQAERAAAAVETSGSAATAAAGEPPAQAAGSVGGGSGRAVDWAAADRLAALFPRLQVLNLEDNRLSRWSSVALLSRLPALSRLHLTGNEGLGEVWYPAEGAEAGGAQGQGAPGSSGGDGSGGGGGGSSGGGGGGGGDGGGSSGSAPFGRLAALFLGGCGIGGWGSVDQLDAFPALRELRLSGNPVLALSQAGGRFEVVARVSGLTALNGAEVRPRERRDAELRYLAAVAAEAEAAARGGGEEGRAAVRAAHPAARRLVALHGAVLASAARGGPGGGSLGASAVELRLTCVAAAAHAKMGTQVKKLPRSTTVAALRGLCEKLFKVPAARMSLFLRTPGDPLPEDIGQQEERHLGYFGVQDGWEVLVDEAAADPGPAGGGGGPGPGGSSGVAGGGGADDLERRLAAQGRTAEVLRAEFARSMGLPPQQAAQGQAQGQGR